MDVTDLRETASGIWHLAAVRLGKSGVVGLGWEWMLLSHLRQPVRLSCGAPGHWLLAIIGNS